jgi:hypothetical protein
MKLRFHFELLVKHVGVKNINAPMKEGSINTCPRKAALLAQRAHESGESAYMEGLASDQAYEGRKDLGKTQKGDGKRFNPFRTVVQGLYHLVFCWKKYFIYS